MIAMQMKTASQVMEERAEKAAARAADAHLEGTINLTDELEITSPLAARIRKDWHRNRSNKIIVEDRLLAALRARKGEYSPSKMADIRQAGGSTLYVKLTTAKIRTAIAHIKSVMMPTGGWSHGVKPTKEPEMPYWMQEDVQNYVMQNPMFLDEQGQPVDEESQIDNIQRMVRVELQKKAKQSARRMERKIYDQLQEGGWRRAMSDFIDDFCTFQAAFIKGPYMVNKPRLKWEMGSDGSYYPITSIQPTMQWRTIDPFDAYPAPGSDSVHKGSFIERLRLSREELYMMRKTPDVYDADAIDYILEMGAKHRLDNWLWTDSERQRIADHTTFWYAQSTDFDGLHWYGEATGHELIEHGVSAAQIEDLDRPYQVDAILIGNQIIKATLNTDPLYRRNINSACYENIPGAVFGNAIADLMDDSQDMVNSAARALQNNLAHASGFQVEVDYTRLHPNTDPSDIYPFKIWQGKESEHSGDRPVARFFQPDSNASELLGVMSHWAAQADIDTGIPAFLHGGGSAEGTSATAKGAAMMKDDSAKLLRSSIVNIDEDVVTPNIEVVYDFNMLYDPDQSIKGDSQVCAKGMNAALQKEGSRQQHMAIMDLLNNPEDRALIGEDRRINVMRNMLDTFEEIDTDEIIPSDDEIEFKLSQQAQMPPPPDPVMEKIAADQRIAEAKIELEREKLAARAEENRGKVALELQKAHISRETSIQVSQDDLDKKMQNEIIKLRAAQHSAFEVGQMDIAKERMKLEARAREKVQDLKNQLALQKQAASNDRNSDNSEVMDKESIQAEIQNIIAPLVDEFKKETIEAVNNLADMVNSDTVPSGDINVSVNLPDCAPGTKKVTTSRDAQGNLQATITPEGE